jgi:hypothetical protein
LDIPVEIAANHGKWEIIDLPSKVSQDSEECLFGLAVCALIWRLLGEGSIRVPLESSARNGVVLGAQGEGFDKVFWALNLIIIAAHCCMLLMRPGAALDFVFQGSSSGVGGL